jgi:divalent metal cation (Fe/Co/Zn/Cd) transporter
VRASVLAATKQRAARALRAREEPHPFGRELIAALAVAVLALPLVVAQAFFVVESGAWLLASWVPEPILIGLGVSYLGSFALGVGALYGSIPLVVAWRRRALTEWT